LSSIRISLYGTREQRKVVSDITYNEYLVTWRFTAFTKIKTGWSLFRSCVSLIYGTSFRHSAMPYRSLYWWS